MEKIANWGNYPVVKATVERPGGKADLQAILDKTEPCAIRGNGRCYGDAALNTHILSTRKLNRILDFNPAEKTLICESGTLLSEILDYIVPKGFFLPVVPGTKFITVGGAIAADVHGKNHEKAGSFSNHVCSFQLMKSNGQIVNCSPENNAETFHTTVGGMGLTGLVITTKLKLRPIGNTWLSQQNLKTRSLRETLEAFENENAEHKAAWLDTRRMNGIVMFADHASEKEVEESKFAKQTLKLKTTSPIKMPSFFPEFALNRTSIDAFNWWYFHKQRKEKTDFLTHYENYFFQLDRLHHWNRIYGKKGFAQYQAVFPIDAAETAINELLGRVNRAGISSFLTVIKKFGNGNRHSPLSFPMEGFTISLDFKISGKMLALLERLDEVTTHFGGKLYLAKDARMSSKTFKKTYPGAEGFVQLLASENGQTTKFQSLQSRRLSLTK